MANYNKKMTATAVRLGEVRFSYAHVFERRRDEDGNDGKYSVCVLIPKTDKQALDMIAAATEAAKQDGKAKKWGGKIPANVKVPLRDGDIEHEDDPTFHGMMFFNASSNSKPGVKVLAGGALSDAIDESDFYSGCWGAVTVNFFPFENSGNKGVAVGLNNLVKTRDDEALAGGSSAESDFADLADDALN